MNIGAARAACWLLGVADCGRRRVAPARAPSAGDDTAGERTALAELGRAMVWGRGAGLAAVAAPPPVCEVAMAASAPLCGSGGGGDMTAL